MMKICASLNSADDVDSEELVKADMLEIRTDVFSAVPDGLPKKEILISFKKGFDKSFIKNDNWLIDSNGSERPNVPNTVISSYHDFTGTPDEKDMKKILSKLDGDIIKGAFTVTGLKDLSVLKNVSNSLSKRHVMLGMGDLGTVTRIRQSVMKNEFTFAYVSDRTAPGQLSVSEMKNLGDKCIITGIVGNGIGYTRSPAMHDAAFRFSGINGKYLTFDVKDIGGLDSVIIDYEIRGLNITKPFKTDIIDILDSVSRESKDIGAVNTVINENGKLTGHNTDVDGIRAAMNIPGLNITGKRALIIGSGGAARSCAYFLSKKCDVTVVARNHSKSNELAQDFKISSKRPESVALKTYDIIVNCTPVGTAGYEGTYPVSMVHLDREQTVFDMVYGLETPMLKIAKERGCRILRGEDMLAGQGIGSFRMWTGHEVPFSIMRDVI